MTRRIERKESKRCVNAISRAKLLHIHKNHTHTLTSHICSASYPRIRESDRASRLARKRFPRGRLSSRCPNYPQDIRFRTARCVRAAVDDDDDDDDVGKHDEASNRERLARDAKAGSVFPVRVIRT